MKKLLILLFIFISCNNDDDSFSAVEVRELKLNFSTPFISDNSLSGSYQDETFKIENNEIFYHINTLTTTTGTVQTINFEFEQNDSEIDYSSFSIVAKAIEFNDVQANNQDPENILVDKLDINKTTLINNSTGTLSVVDTSLFGGMSNSFDFSFTTTGNYKLFVSISTKDSKEGLGALLSRALIEINVEVL